MKLIRYILSMGCKNCKQKQVINQKSAKEKKILTSPIKSEGKWINWIIIIWLLFGVYGLYSIIKDVLNLL